MPNSTIIAAVRGREVLDSRGNPTVEVDVTLRWRRYWSRHRSVGSFHWTARGG